MKYKNILNKDLRIAGIHITDLPLELTNEILKQWDDGSPIESLTIYYDKQADYLVINIDHNKSLGMLFFVETYMTLTDQERENYKQDGDKARPCDVFNVIDECISYRRIAQLMRISGEIIVPKVDGISKLDLYKSIRLRYDDEYTKMDTAYNCGYIQGIRNERARRKAAGGKHR